MAEALPVKAILIENSVASKLFALIQGFDENGATNEDLSNGLPDIEATVRLEAMNKLLSDGFIELLKKGDQLIYRAKVKKTKDTLPKDANNEEKIVFGLVEEAGNKGITLREIRIRSNLNITLLINILKNMEIKMIIKSVKVINAGEKKVYMLKHIEPHRSVTGGALYHDQELEEEFVDVLNQQCLRYLRMKREEALKTLDGPLVAKQLSCCTVKEVHKFLDEIHISNVQLDIEDVESILKLVVYDGNAERTLQSDGSYVYRAVNQPLALPGLVQMPCGVCPIIKHCGKIGDVTPLKCQYFKDWLDI